MSKLLLRVLTDELGVLKSLCFPIVKHLSKQFSSQTHRLPELSITSPNKQHQLTTVQFSPSKRLSFPTLCTDLRGINLNSFSLFLLEIHLQVFVVFMVLAK